MSALCDSRHNFKPCVRLRGHEGAHNAGAGDDFVEWSDVENVRCDSTYKTLRCQKWANRADGTHPGVHSHTSDHGRKVQSWGNPDAPCDFIDDKNRKCDRELGHEGIHIIDKMHLMGGDDHGAMKDGKLMLELVDLEFVADMARQLQAGLVGDRVPDGWRKLDPATWLPKYRGALLRHLVAAQRGPGAIDEQTGATHWAGVAVNAMICGVLERIAKP